MLHYALIFFVVALVAAVLGFRGVAGMSAQFGYLFAVIAVISVLTTWVRRQMLDEQSWRNASAELIADPQVRHHETGVGAAGGQLRQAEAAERCPSPGLHGTGRDLPEARQRPVSYPGADLACSIQW